MPSTWGAGRGLLGIEGVCHQGWPLRQQGLGMVVHVSMITKREGAAGSSCKSCSSNKANIHTILQPVAFVYPPLQRVGRLQGSAARQVGWKSLVFGIAARNLHMVLWKLGGLRHRITVACSGGLRCLTHYLHSCSPPSKLQGDPKPPKAWRRY